MLLDIAEQEYHSRVAEKLKEQQNQDQDQDLRGKLIHYLERFTPSGITAMPPAPNASHNLAEESPLKPPGGNAMRDISMNTMATATTMSTTASGHRYSNDSSNTTKSRNSSGMPGVSDCNNSDSYEESEDSDDASEDISVHSHHSAGSTDRHNNTKDPDNNKMELARKETTAVFRLRLLVFLVLLLAAIAVSVLVYLITSNAEKVEYRSQYEGASKKLIEAFLNIVTSKLGAVSSLGVANIAHGVDHLRSWPFVTLSSFQQRAATARSLSRALYVHVNPYVTDENQNEWEQFVTSEDAYWVDEGLEYQEYVGLFDFVNNSKSKQIRRVAYGDEYDASLAKKVNNMTYHQDSNHSQLPIWYRDEHYRRQIDNGPGPYMPMWESSPIFHQGQDLNDNLLRAPREQSEGANQSFLTSSVVISPFIFAPPGGITDEAISPETAFYALLLSTARQELVQYDGDPLSCVYFPLFNNFQDDRRPVAVLTTWIHWASYFRDVLPTTLNGILLVMSDSCGGAYTLEVRGEQVHAVGLGDLHDPMFDNMKRSANFDAVSTLADGTKSGLPFHKDHCRVVVDVYPSRRFYDVYNTSTPLIITSCVAIIFIFTACMFVLYDTLVERRQALVMKKAEQTHKIVSSLFPSSVADRLIKANDDDKLRNFVAPTHRLKGFLKNGSSAEMDGNGDDAAYLGDPIADLFPHCSVLFADISGFTAWSSSREPAQVFVLLQTVYQAFDVIAKRRRVFKVETIGDSYVAVTGLPEPQPNHAVIMARFAGECLTKMSTLVAHLESSLGPDTADLAMRFGIHSGPVTAGVLRGERARFQLFGDTVNTAARMESTGIRSKIQVSEATYNLLVAAGKIHWLRPRPDAVHAKGKGVLKTYFLTPNAKQKGSHTGSSRDVSDHVDMHTPTLLPEGSISRLDGEANGGAFKSSSSLLGDTGPSINVISEKSKSHLATLLQQQQTQKKDRLVDWIVDLLQDQVKKVVAQNNSNSGTLSVMSTFGIDQSYMPVIGVTPLDEVAEVIILPRFDAKKFNETENHRSVNLQPNIIRQLREFVSIIASLYNDNPFHNFEHACHVTMATNKFLKRIVAPEITIDGGRDIASKLHEYTHGINSDPLTVLAILISALIHDADHRGVSNMQLITEQPNMANLYKNKSVAEQNSLDIAWDLLMSDQFQLLRRCMFTSENELRRFRQVLVNVVLATDIFDKELNQLRKNRWDKAFSDTCLSSEENNDLRATIVIEHIIQASDVSHTMQHWHIYRKWNERLFMEMYAAYKAGRMEKDPSEFWFQGELGFFDNYIIPLAKKLKECNVFGVSSDECLNYALQNRAEWADRGKDILAEMMQRCSVDTADRSIASSQEFVQARVEC